MTVYVDYPFGGLGGGMRNPAPYGGGMAGGLMNKPPPFMPQQPMPQMPMDGGYDGSGYAGGLMAKMGNPPRRMPGGPSKGGNTTTFPPMQGPMRGPQMPMPPMQRPPMQRPGGPGKARTGQRGGLMRRGRGSLMRGGPGKGRGQMQQPMPARPSFDQLMTQGPMNMPQPMGPPNNLQFQQVGNNRPLPSFMGRVGQARTQGPTSIPNSPFMMQQGGMGFYGGGITDLY